jgi:hypothetical protein
MPGLIKSKVTFANVVSCVALFVALGGGAYALTLKENSVGTKQLKSDAVRSQDVKDATLTGTDILESSLDLPPELEGPRGPEGPPGADGSPDTPQQVLDKLSTVDGPGSGLDADSVDGLAGADLVPAADIVAMRGTAGGFTGAPSVISLPPVGGDLELRVRCIDDTVEGEVDVVVEGRVPSGGGNVFWFGVGSGGAPPVSTEETAVDTGFTASSRIFTIETNADDETSQTGTMLFTPFTGSTVIAVHYRVDGDIFGGVGSGECEFDGLAVRG